MESQANPIRFRAIIDEALLEPGVLQGLLGCDALLGVVDKDALEQVEEVAVEGGIGGDKFLHKQKSVMFQVNAGAQLHSQSMLSLHERISVKPVLFRRSDSRACSG